MGEKFSFLHETIKDKPLEKKTVINNIIIALALGLMFGVVAAISFTISNYGIDYFIAKSKVKEVKIEKENTEDRQQGVESTSAAEKGNTAPEHLDANSEKYENMMKEYEDMYSFMYSVAKNAESSMVPVLAVESDTDWFSERYESSVQGTGLIIADNRRELLILVNHELVCEAETIKVIMPDGAAVDAKEIEADSLLNLCVIGVKLEDISDEAMSKIEMARLGNSWGGLNTGKAIVAAGAPMGEYGSIGYGMILSSNSELQIPDTNVHILTTNIYGSANGSGILVNLKGEVIGLISHESSKEGAENLIVAYGISDIKDCIERLCNNNDRAYLGVYITEPDRATREQMEIPEGVYVTEIEPDSPAMINGLQSGDVIVMVGSNEIRTQYDFDKAMNKLQPGKETVITVQRYVRGSYKELTFDVNVSKQ